MATVPRDGPFVGREAELAELTARLAEAADGSGGLVLLSGPPGMGKTRLVEELAPAAGTVAWGRCVDDPGVPPLWPWRQVLRRLPAAGAAVREALADVDLQRGPSADPAAARFRLVAAATEALLAEGEPDGLLVVLEDLHWADESSLRLLRHLAGELHGSRLLVVGTHRDPPGDVDGLLLHALPDLLRWPGTRPIALPPLDEEAVRRYLGARAGGPGHVRALHRRSGGNPLFLRALTWARAPGSASGPPGSGLRAVVRSTLTALPPATLDLVDTAAVLGEEVDVDALTAVTGLLPAQVATALDAAVAAGVLTADPGVPGRRRFLHAVVRDAVYEDLSPSTREELHRRAAEALEGLAPAGVVAGHWLRAASDPAGLRRAATWTRRAAAAATRTLAFEDAARFLTSAVELADRNGAEGPERAELLLELATAEYRAGRFAESLEHAAAASELAEGLARPDLLASAALVVHDVAAPGFAAAQQRLCERALAAVGGRPVVRSRLLAQLASVLADIGRSAASSAHSAEALDLAERSGDPEALLDAARARMKSSWRALDVAERMRLGLLAIEHSGTAGQPLAALWGAKWRIDAALEAGDMPVVEEELARVGELAARTRLPLVRWHDVRLRASVAALLGRFPEACALNDEARELAATQLAQDPSAAGMSSAFLQQHILVTGGFTEPDSATAAVLDRAPSIPVVAVSRVVWALLRGDADRAAALYDGMRAAMADPEFLTSVGVAINLVPLLESLGDDETARRLADCLRDQHYAAGGAGIYGTGSAAQLRGRLALVLGRTEEALDSFEEALQTDARTGARPATVQDRVGLAAALLDRGRPADLARARELARSALTEARRLGMPGPAAQAAGLLERATARLRAADPLTDREREIADLVATALTNRQIADRLVLSERTVETHVGHILAKLGLANRTELATAVIGSRGGQPLPDQSRAPTAR